MQEIFKVTITNEKTQKIFDRYLIKVKREELPEIEKQIHKRHPNSILSIRFTIGENSEEIVGGRFTK